MSRLAALAAALAVSTAEATAFEATLVEQPSSYINGPQSVSVADFNEDGLDDLLVSSLYDSSVTWYANNGDGTMTEGLVTSVSYPRDAVAADIDDDGHQDAVYAVQIGDAIGWSLGDGAGGFAASTTVTIASQARGVRVGDVNSDGDVDLVYTTGDFVAYLEGPSFLSSVTVGTESGAFMLYPALHDWDDDGDLDIAVPFGNDGIIRLFTNDGTGAFGTTTDLTSGNQVMRLRFGDTDLDGDMDLVAAVQGGDVELFVNTAGVFATTAIAVSTTTSGASGVTLADTDGDGDLDIAVASMYDDKLSWYEGYGDNSWGSEVVVATGSFVDGAIDVAAGDFDHDGTVDLAVVGETSDQMWLAFGHSVPDAPPGVTAAPDSAQGVLVTWSAAPDGGVEVTQYTVTYDDGETATTTALSLELGPLTVGANYSFTVQAENSFGLGAASAPVFAVPTLVPVVEGDLLQTLVSTVDGPHRVTAGDLEGDGLVDFFVAGSSSLSVFAAGAGGAQTTLGTTVSGASDVLCADLNADGEPELVGVARDADAVLWFQNYGGGVLGSAATIAFATNNAPHAVRARDVDDDGSVDLVVSLEGAGQVVAVAGPAFDTTSVLISGLSAPHFFCFADLDGDGVDDDLLVADFGADALVWDGGGSVADLDEPRVVAAGDLDADGDDDVVVACTSQVVMLTNVGAGVFAAPVALDTTRSPYNDVLLADLDLDGDLDVVIPGAWFENPGFAPVELDSSDDWDGVAVADVDADGDDDLALVADSSSGTVAWLPVLTVPPAPTDVAVEAGDGQLTVSWTAPTDNGVDITQYVIGSETFAGSPATLTGLVNGQEYAVTVAAETARGLGPYSAAVTGSPFVRLEMPAAALLSTSYDNGADDMTVGDVTGDGVPDLVVAGFESDSVTSFSAVTGVETVLVTGLDAPAAIAVGDLDGDGDLDLVAASFYNNLILWYEGPSFSSMGSYDVGTSQPGEVKIADLNHDGDNDILYSESYGSKLSYLQGPAFGSSTTISSGVPGCTSALVADIDDDGDLDVFASFQDDVRWFRNNGAGAFSQVQTDASYGYPEMVRAGDMDGDGTLDLLYASESNSRIGVMYNSAGASTLDGAVGVGANTVNSVDGFDVADLDLDGDLDVVVGYDAGKLAWYENLGDRDFADAVDLEAAAGNEVRTIQCIDWDQDGDLDVAITSFIGDFVAVAETQSTPFAPPSLDVVDVGDGFIELQWAASEDDNGAPVTSYVVSPDGWTVNGTSITIDGLTNGVTYDFSVAAQSYRGAGPASAATASATPTTRVEIVDDVALDGSTSASKIAGGDFDGDGLPDVASATTSHILVHAHDGTLLASIGAPGVATLAAAGSVLVAGGTLGVQLFVDFSLTATRDAGGSTVRDVAVADDGRVFFGTDAGLLAVFESSDNNTYTTLYNTPTADAIRALSLADVNSDGALDVVAATFSDNEVLVLHGGTTLAQTITGLSRPRHFAWLGLDLLVADRLGDVELFANDGAGLFTYSRSLTGLSKPRGVVVVDLDMDGADDLAVAHADGVAWYRGLVDAERVALLVTEDAGDWRGLVAADFDNDGDLDLASDFDADGGDGTVHMLLVGTVPFAPPAVVVQPSGVAGQVNVSWGAADGNGAPVLGYEVSDTTGVVPGQAFAVNVSAVNYRGTGPAAAVEYNSCADGAVGDDAETDVDCGGGVCAACAAGLQCLADSDCVDDKCEPATGRCASCSDGVQNRDETGVDCGGSFCAPCVRCRGGDYSVAVEWDAVPEGDIFVNGGLVGGADTSLTLDGLDNYVAVTTNVSSSATGFTLCTATPQPPRAAVTAAVDDLWAANPSDLGFVSPALGDVDGDGVVDAVVGSQSSGLSVFLGNGSHLLPDADGALYAGVPAVAYLRPALADGGVLAVGAEDGSVTRFSGPDDASGGQLLMTASSGHSAPALADVDSDGALDLFVGDVDGAVQLCWGADDYASCEVWLAAAAGTHAAPAACDVDGDGDVDVLVGSSTGALELVENVGDPGAPAWDFAPASNPFPSVDSFSAPACAATTGVVAGSLDQGVALFVRLAAHPEAPALELALTAALAAEVDWAAPYDGGAAISQYEVASNWTAAPLTTTAAAGGLAFAALPAGQAVAFWARATNAQGSSGWSAPVALRLPQVRVSVSGANVSWAVDAAALDFAEATLVEPPGTLLAGTDVRSLAVEGSCEPLAVNVSLLAGDGSVELWGTGVAAAPAAGVCARSCPSASGWVDPSQTDPFAVDCDGNWTALPQDWRRVEALAFVSAETLVNGSLLLDCPVVPGGWCTATDTDTGLQSLEDLRFFNNTVTVSGQPATTTAMRALALDTTATTQPPEFVNAEVDLATDVAWASNVPAAYVEVSVDGGEWAAAAADSFPVVDGQTHEVRARSAVDGAWLPTESTPAAVAWTYDTTAPSVTFSERPGEFSADTTPVFGVAATEEGVVFEYCVDSAEACGSVTSGAGASDPPETELVSTTATADGVVVAAVSDPAGAALQVAVDSGDWVTPGSGGDDGEVVVSGLAAGWHSVYVRAVADGVADASPLVVGVVVGEDDDVPPDTWLSAAPAAVVAVGDALELAADADEAGCSFELSVDGGASWGALELGLEPAAAVGFFSALVRAVDAAGNADPSPALAAWQVVERPTYTVELQPPALSPFAAALVGVRVRGGSACAVPYELRDAATGALVASGTDDDAFLALGPLEFGSYALSALPECDGVAAADALEIEWEVTAEAVAEEFSAAVGDEGAHWAWVRGTDRAGNVGPTTTFNWTVDLTPPETAVEWPASALSGSTFAAVASCDDAAGGGCTFSVSLGGAADFSDDDGAFVLTNLTDGAHTVEVSAVDQAGNADATPETFDFVVDTTPPQQLRAAATSGAVAALPTFAASCDDCVDVRWAFDDAPVVNELPVSDFDADEGSHVLVVVGTDEAGNAASVEVAFVADWTAPASVVAEAPATSTRSLVPVLLNCSDAVTACHLNVSVDGGAPWAVPAPTHNLTLPDGALAVAVRAVDEAGNAGAAVELDVLVDTVAPVLAVAGVAYAGGGRGNVTLACSEAPCAVSVASTAPSAGDVEVVVGDDGTFASTGAADGSAELCFAAEDAVGNEAAELACATVLLDATPPAVALLQAPDAVTRDAWLDVAVDAPDAAACECLLDGVAVAGCGTGLAVAAGAHEFEARCVDAAGNWAAQSAAWTVDLDSPTLSVVWPPAASAASTLVMNVSAADGTSALQPLACTVVTPSQFVASVADCAPVWEVAATEEGDFALVVVATDAAGRSVNASATVAVDRTAPVVALDVAPAAVTTAEDAQFEFRCVLDSSGACGELESDGDCSLTYALDGGAETAHAAETPLLLLDLSWDTHTLVVTAADAAGNTASATHVWTVATELLPPDILVAPPSPNALQEAEFAWSGSGGFEYRVDDDGQWVSTESNSVVLEGLALGAHTFSVRLVGGTLTSYSWTVAACSSAGELQFAGVNGTLICEACPSEGVQCVNGAAVLLDGYWRSSAAAEVRGSDVFYRCPTATSCLGGAACREGHTGVLCEVCAPGYTDSVGGCRPCPSSSGGAVALLVGVLAASIALLAAVLKRSKQIVQGSAFKVILNFVHMVSATVACNAEWPALVESVGDVIGVVNVDFADLTAAGCTDVPVSFYTRWAAAIAVPVVIVGGIWVRKVLLNRERSASIRNSLLVLLFLYPGVSGMLIQFFNCEQIEGRWYLKADYSEECFSGAWYAWLVVALVLTPLFVLGVPAKMLYWLVHHRDSLNDEETVRSVGLLYRSYRLEQYHHEVFSLVYKTGLWITAVLLAGGVITQMVVTLFLTLAALIYHAVSWPYRDVEKNWLQLLNYVCVMTLGISGLCLRVTESGGATDAELRHLGAWLDSIVVAQLCALAVGALGVKLLRRRRKRLDQSQSKEKETELTDNPMLGAATMHMAVNSRQPFMAGYGGGYDRYDHNYVGDGVIGGDGYGEGYEGYGAPQGGGYGAPAGAGYGGDYPPQPPAGAGDGYDDGGGGYGGQGGQGGQGYYPQGGQYADPQQAAYAAQLQAQQQQLLALQAAEQQHHQLLQAQQQEQQQQQQPPQTPRSARRMRERQPQPEPEAGRGNNFKVVIRVRPPLPRELNGDKPFQNVVHVDSSGHVITISENLSATGADGAALDGQATGPYSTHQFTFDHVYDQNSTQREVYETTAQPVVESSLMGYNATIFAYGQTGTGKTYTMEGFNSANNVEERGIIPRAIEQIFRHIQSNVSSRMRFLVRASYLQIYNETISDLLKPERNNLSIREDRKRGVFVEGLSEWVVRSPAEIYGLMQRGGAVRATGSTKMNEISSRSHAVFIIIAEQSETIYMDEQGGELSAEEFTMLASRDRGEAMSRLEHHVRQSFKVGKLNLVDLAGSERVRLSGATGQRLEESKKINQSLSALGNVIAALTDPRGRQHIPYRDSKLTRILEDSLGGNCKTTMMAMASPALEAFTESLSTLKFANRAKNIKNEARINEDLDQKSLLRKYERELKRLRAELEERNRNVVDKRRLLELDEQRRRAEEDKMAAIRALEARSLEFMREKEEKRRLEERIAMLTSQMLMSNGRMVEGGGQGGGAGGQGGGGQGGAGGGGGGQGGGQGGGEGGEGDGDFSTENPQFRMALKEHQDRIRQEYESRLADLERERETIEEEKAQVDRYKQLLLKQRDIMIALTQRLNERDEQIMALQDELDAYDRHQKQLEEKLDEKTAQLIHLQRVTIEHNANSPIKSNELAQALGEWGDGAGGHGRRFVVADSGDGSAPPQPVQPAELISYKQYSPHSAPTVFGQHGEVVPADSANPDNLLSAEDKIRELTRIIEACSGDNERLGRELEEVQAEKVSMEYLLREKLERLVQSEIESRMGSEEGAAGAGAGAGAAPAAPGAGAELAQLRQRVADLEAQNQDLHAQYSSFRQDVSARLEEKNRLVKQLEDDSASAAAAPSGGDEALRERCATLAKERKAVQTIMEQKVKTLVNAIAQASAAIQEGGGNQEAVHWLGREVSALQRLVNASIAALRNADANDTAAASASASASPPRAPAPAPAPAASPPSSASSYASYASPSAMSVDALIQQRKAELQARRR